MTLPGTNESGVSRLIFMGLVAACACVMACAEEERRENGSVCASSGQCSSGLCYNATCIAPLADDDGDGLLNQEEAALGTWASGPLGWDTDGDLISDGVEVGEDPDNPRDADGDYVPGVNQSHDANESLLEDSDGGTTTPAAGADAGAADTDLS